MGDFDDFVQSQAGPGSFDAFVSGSQPKTYPLSDEGRAKLAAMPAAQRPTDLLATPEVVDRQTTALARAYAEAATRPPGAPPPNDQRIEATSPGLGTRMLDVFRNSGVGKNLGFSSRTAEAEREDPTGNGLARFQELTPKPGIARGAAEFASSLTTPESLIMMAVSGGLGTLTKQIGAPLVNRLVSAGFSASMLADAVRQVPKLREAWNQQDWPNVRQQLTKIALGTSTAALAARGALRGEPGAKAEPKPNETAKTPVQEYTSTGEPVRKVGQSFAEFVAESNAKVQPKAAEKPVSAGQKTSQPAPKPAAAKPPAAPKGTTEPEPKGTEYFRGAWNLPLNAEGHAQVKAAAEKNAGQFTSITAGTKQRHLDTAEAYRSTSPGAGKVEANKAYDPMNLGMHEGEEITPERIADLNHRMLNQPSEPIPGTGKFSGVPGEAPGAWKDQLIGAVQDKVAKWKPGDKDLVVTSGRDTQAVRAWVAKGMPADRSVDAKTLTDRWETQPGEMMRLDPATGKVENVDTAKKPGIYFARHGETDGNDNAAVPAEVRHGVAEKPQAAEPRPAAAEMRTPPPAGSAKEVSTPELANSEPPRPDESKGVYFGSGLGALEPLFREAKAEGDRLRLERNKALQAAKLAQASPDEKKAGEKLRFEYTKERDLWSATANQALDIVSRKILPKIQDREAVAIAREFRNKPQELQQFINGSHPYLAEASGSLKKLRPVMEHAMRMLANGMTAKEAAADQVYTNISSESLNEGIRTGALGGSRWDPDVYVPHILNAKGEGEVAQLPSTRGRAMGKIGKYFGFAERRQDKYPTLVHAVADGLIPKTLDASAAFTIHSDQFARARATRLFTASLEESGLGKWGAGDRVPEGWEPLAPHTEEWKRIIPFMRQVEGGTPEAAQSVALAKIEGLQAGKSYSEVSGPAGATPALVPDFATQRLYVPSFIAKALHPITAPDYLANEVPGFAQFRTLQRGLKEAILGLSGFHLLTENLMAKASMGPGEMWKALKTPREDPATLANERDLIGAGGTTSIAGNTMNAYRTLKPGTIPTRGEMIRAYIPGSKQLLEVADGITNLTFENVQRRYKIWDFAYHRDAWMNDNPHATPEQISEAKKGIASYVNGVYGGLHWENMGINRAMLEVGRAVFLAPDWSGSNIALAKYAVDARPSLQELGRHRLAGATTKEAVQARLSRAFWTKQMVEAMTENQMLSLLFSGRLSPRPFQVYLGQDKDGRDVYQNVVFRGSLGDAISLGTKIDQYGPAGVGVFVGSKAAPFTKAGIHQLTGRNDFGKEIANPDLSFPAKTIRWAGSLLMDVSPIPIIVRSTTRSIAGDESDSYLWSERFLTLFGQPAQHKPPEGMRMGPEGLEEKPYREQHSFSYQVWANKP